MFGLAWLERMLMAGDLHLPVPALILAWPVHQRPGPLYAKGRSLDEVAEVMEACA